jgi:cysteate synthase
MANASSRPGRHYVLACTSCGGHYDDDGHMLDCPVEHSPALLQTQYDDLEFSPSIDHDGVFRYQRWLPVVDLCKDAGRTVVYRSSGLAGALGLANLWIAFNGFWPERGATLETATFKDLEAYSVLGRMPGSDAILTVASAGNTGAAFAWACSQQQAQCLLIIPAKGMRRFRFRDRLDSCVNIVTIDDGEYGDAIDLAAAISELPQFQSEGGVKNVGRRDGLATVLLSAFEEMKELPSYYFQAVGSGTGAIAVHEAAKRLQSSVGGMTLPRLMLCQNLPFTPIYDAWRSGQCSPLGASDSLRDALKKVYADELTNWTPPYHIRGGVYDSLVESRGDVLATNNSAAQLAVDEFLELEGIDIEPAAGVAVACLREAAVQGRVEKEAVVLLNITGGGRLRLGRDYPLVPAQPRLRLTRSSLATDAVQQILALYGA